MIDLELGVSGAEHHVGDRVAVAVFAKSDSGVSADIAAMRVIVKWDPSALKLMGVDDSGAPDWAFSGYPPDAFWINEEKPIPEDGNALWEGWGELGEKIVVKPGATLMTTLVFEALTVGRSRVKILKKLRIDKEYPKGETKVYDGYVPNKNVVGDLGDPVKVQVRKT